MKVPATYISFQQSGIVKLMLSNRVEQQIDEAVVRCDNMDEEANLVDQNMNVVARVRRTPGAMNGFAVFWVEQPAVVS